MKKRSIEIETMVTTDAAAAPQIQNRKSRDKISGKPQYENGARKQVKKSDTAKFSMRYVPEFLKHFKGSFINAIMRNICEIAPRIQIAKNIAAM
jgi:uncharacterized protein (DUF2147 family)